MDGKIDLTEEFNIGPNSVFYEKFRPILDYFPAEMAEKILSELPEEDLIILSGNTERDDPIEGPDYEPSELENEYGEDFELFGNQLIEESDEEDEDFYL